MPTVQGFNTTSGVLKYNAESLDNYNTPLFDSTSTYEVGDYVIENGKLYRCITDVSTAGDWSSVSSNFVAAILTDDIKNIKGNVSELTTDVSTLENDVETLGDNVETLSTDVQTLSTNVNNLGTSVNKINNSIAPMFSALTSYNSGDYVIYGGSLYRFTSDHTAGAWTGIDAVQVKLAEDMVFIPGTGEGSATMREDSASGQYSFAQGQDSDASGLASSAFGNNTLANGRAQFVIGQANIEDTEDASSYGVGAKKHIFIVGNGLDASNRSNAFALDWDGNVELSGAITVDKGKNTEFKLSGTSVDAAFLHNTASGSIASFSDGADGIPMKSVLCTINPLQDLHGYDAPWPAGGGKNKLPMTLAGIKAANTTGTWSGNSYTLNGITANVIVDSDDNVTGITVTGTASDTFSLNAGDCSVANIGNILNGCPLGGSASTYRQGIYVGGSAQALDTGTGVTIPSIAETAQIQIRVTSGYAISGTLTFKPMIRLSTESDATFAPYSNICPISGFTGMTIYKTGARIYDKTRNNVGYIRSNGTIFNQSSYRYTDYMQIDGQPFVYGGLSFNDTYSYSAYYDENKQLISTWKQVIGTNVVLPPSTAKYVSISMPDVSVDTFFAYAKATTYPISWETEAGTVYEGTLDVVSGLLTVTMASITLNGSESGIRKVGYTNVDAFSFDNVIPANQAANQGGISFADRFVRGSVTAPNHFFLPTVQNIACSFEVGTFVDLAAFKTYCSANPIQVVYTLATPQTYQLTPTEVDSLLNDNNVWHDINGEISVEYRQNPESLKSRVEALESEVSILNERLFASFPTDMATGAIASFEDGADNIPMESVLCAINPVQDLHGYDSPWPAGGGKNLFNKDALGKEVGYALDYNNGNTYQTGSGNYSTSDFIPVVAGQNYIASGNSKATDYCWYDSDTEFISGGGDINVARTAPTNAAYIRFDYWTADESVVQLEAGSTATAYSPYSNICPISGHTGLTLTRTGKNLLNNSALVHGGLNGNTGASGTTDQRILTDYLFFKAGTYTVSRTSDSIITRVVLCVYDLNENYLIDESHAASWNALNFTFTLTADRLVRFAFAMATNDTIDLDAAKGTLQIELGSTAYAPYQGSTYPVSWQSSAGTVYGGTLDLVSGLLTATYGVFNGSAQAWGWWSTISGFRANVSSLGFAGIATNTPINGICNIYKPTSRSSAPTADMSFGITVIGASLFVKDSRFDSTTVNAFNTAIADAVFVLPLATPQTYQLTPTEVDSLLGDNRLWHDANGNIEANYYADTTLFINKKIAAAIASLS